MQSDYVGLLKKVASQVGVSPELLSAIVSVESSWDPYAVRYEPQYSYILKADYFANLNQITVGTETQLQKFSWGLGQIMGGTARGLGFAGPLPSLCSPEFGLYWAAINLKKLTVRYADQDEQIAAYNAGSAITKGSAYINQGYVNKVRAALT